MAFGPSVEVCDGLDNDCDGSTDEVGCVCAVDGAQVACGINQGVCVEGRQTCRAGSWSECEGAVLPWSEVCDDGRDNDCDGSTDEDCLCSTGATVPCGTDIGTCSAGTQTCRDSLWGVCEGFTAPAPESCDSLDNNCNGSVDEGCPCPTVDEVQPCGTDVGACVAGIRTCRGGVWSLCDGGVLPMVERCDGLDNDCDGATDEGEAEDAAVWYPDADGDGYGAAEGSTRACVQPPGLVAVDGDCDDGDPQTHPGMPELCDGADNNCDGVTDESCRCLGAATSLFVVEGSDPTTQRQSRLWRVDVATGLRTLVREGPEGFPTMAHPEIDDYTDVAVDPESRRVFLSVNTRSAQDFRTYGTILAVDFDTGQRVDLWGPSDGLRSAIALSANGIGFYFDGEARPLAVGSVRPWYSFSGGYSGWSGPGIATTDDGRLVFGTMDNLLIRWEPEAPPPSDIHWLGGLAGGTSVAVTGTGDTLYVVNSAGVLREVSVGPPATVLRSLSGLGALVDVALDLSETVLYALDSAGGIIHRVDLATWTVTPWVAGFSTGLRAATASCVMPRPIKVPVRWCGVRGAPSMDDPTLVGAASTDDVLVDRLETVNSAIYMPQSEVSFTPGVATSGNSFPLLEDPRCASGCPAAGIGVAGEVFSGGVCPPDSPVNPGGFCLTASGCGGWPCPRDDFEVIELINLCRRQWEAVDPSVTGITAVHISRFVKSDGAWSPLLGLGGTPRECIAWHTSAFRTVVADLLLSDPRQKVLGHELGHALSLRHGNGLDDNGDGVVDDADEPVGAPGAETNLMGGGITLTAAQASQLRFEALGHVPDVVIDPITLPLANSRTDLLGDVPPGLAFADIDTFGLEVSPRSETTTFHLTTVGALPSDLPAVTYYFVVDLDSSSSTGGAASALGVPSAFVGAELVGVVHASSVGGIVFVSRELYRHENGTFVTVADPSIDASVEAGRLSADADDNLPELLLADFESGVIARITMPNGVRDTIAEDLVVETLVELYGQVVDVAGGPLTLRVPVFPSCNVEPPSARRGESVTLTFDGFTAVEALAIRLDMMPVATAIANASGKGQMTFEIPDAAQRGYRAVMVRHVGTARVATCSLLVGGRPPIADAGSAASIECQGELTPVLLDGSASSDADGDDLALSWNGTFGRAEGVDPTVLFPVGSHEVTLVAVDADGLAASDSVTVVVGDETPPSFDALGVTPDCLWPPNHRYVPYAIGDNVLAEAFDDCDGPVSVRVVSVESSEGEDDEGDGATSRDFVLGPSGFCLRAERAGGGESGEDAHCGHDSGHDGGGEERGENHCQHGGGHGHGGRWKCAEGDGGDESSHGGGDHHARGQSDARHHGRAGSHGSGRSGSSDAGCGHDGGDQHGHGGHPGHGRDNGRTYTITFEATDVAGNVNHLTRVVRVPHDRRRNECPALPAEMFVDDGDPRCDFSVPPAQGPSDNEEGGAGDEAASDHQQAFSCGESARGSAAGGLVVVVGLLARRRWRRSP